MIGIAKLETPIHPIHWDMDNEIYMKREDLLPFSFGGNKARKALFFFDEIGKGDFDTIVTYGSSWSNHCRVVANAAVSKGYHAHLICPEESSSLTMNQRFMRIIPAAHTFCPVAKVRETIDQVLCEYKKRGKKPYFIQGGGHGILGTMAYCYVFEEILIQERNMALSFDYIFHASGTGTTQAGLISGNTIHRAGKRIVGISIARSLPRGKEIVKESVRLYVGKAEEKDVLFIDDYVGKGYGKYSKKVEKIIDVMIRKNGIAFDPIYTGKAFLGMEQYLLENKIRGKKILFIHTGGTPLFFDYLMKKK